MSAQLTPSGSKINQLARHYWRRPIAGIGQWWRNLSPWSSDHPARWGVATGLLTGLIWFGVAYAIDPELGIGSFVFPVLFGAAIGFGYYVRARVDQSSF
jgi:hypothetical protein